MNITRALGLLLLSVTLTSAHAIKICDGAGSSRRIEPTPFDLHRSLQRQSFQTYRQPDRRDVAFFISPVEDTSIRPVTARPRLVLNSLVFDVDLEFSDIFRRSQAQGGEFIVKGFIIRNLDHLVPGAVHEFDAARAVAFTPGVEPTLAKGVAYFPERTAVTYRGPVAVQVLSRNEFVDRGHPTSNPEIIHQTVAHVGLELKWWSQGTDAIYSRARPLATIDSRDLTVRPGTRKSDLFVNLDPADWSHAVDVVRAIITDERANAYQNDQTFDLKPIDFRVRAYLLNDQLATIAEYPLDPSLTKRLIAEAAGQTSTLHTCGQWLNSIISAPKVF